MKHFEDDMTKHTPGPWEVVGNPPTEIGAMLHSPDAIIVADTRLMHGTPTARQLADAELIARAPDLLAENERLRSVLHRIAHLDESDESERDAGDIAYEALAGLS